MKNLYDEKRPDGSPGAFGALVVGTSNASKPTPTTAAEPLQGRAYGQASVGYRPTGDAQQAAQRRPQPRQWAYVPPLAADAAPGFGNYTADAMPRGFYRGGPNGRCAILSRDDDAGEVAAMHAFCAAVDPKIIGHVKEIFCDSKCGRYAIVLYGERAENDPVVQAVIAAFEGSVKGHSGVDVFREVYVGEEEEWVCSRLSDCYPAE